MDVENIGPVILSVAFFLPGCYLLFTMLRPHLHVIRSRKWQSTSGWVTETKLAVGIEFVSGQRAPHFWTPQVRYTYTVDGTEYWNDRVNFVGYNGGRAVKVQVRYDTSRRVTVWYNPDNPADSVLDRNPNVSSILFTLIALGWVGLSGWALFITTSYL